MKEFVLHSFAFNLVIGNKLVADLQDDQMCLQPVAGRTMNHPAFLLGHVAWANDRVAASFLGEEPKHDAAWMETYGIGAKPHSNRAGYATKVELLAALAASHGRLSRAFADATPEQLAAPAPEMMRRVFPTLGHLLVGLMTGHEANHWGQLSAWRRASGFPSIS